MKLISLYLIRRLSVMSGYALLALLALYSFFDVVKEAAETGSGGYTGATAAKYVLMQLPAHAYQLMPLAVLIGGLVALNQLASNSELAVIKTSGLSTGNIVSTLLKFGLVFALLTIILGEMIAPELSRRADKMKIGAKIEQTAAAQFGLVSTGKNGIWLRQNNSMINIVSVLPDNTLMSVKIWRYDENFRLSEAVYAASAKVRKSRWILSDVHSSRFEGDRVLTEHKSQREWPSSAGRRLLSVLAVKPEQMSLRALTDYIRYLETNRQQSTEYRVAWWNKLIYPVATLVMALVALAFTPVSGRSSNMGMKLFGGICLGLLFYFAGRLFGFTSRLYGIPPALAAALPTAAFALAAVWLIRRQEKR